jgi:hypothetical protein
MFHVPVEAPPTRIFLTNNIQCPSSPEIMAVVSPLNLTHLSEIEKHGRHEGWKDLWIQPQEQNYPCSYGRPKDGMKQIVKRPYLAPDTLDHFTGAFSLQWRL